MSLRFLADHCVPRSMIQALHVMRLSDHFPSFSDKLVIEKTLELNAILIFIKSNKADIVAYLPSEYSGILCLQLRNRPFLIPILMNQFLYYLAENGSQEHYRGKLLLVETHRIRIRS